MSIMNETSVLPLTMNIFAACFCMGCSALYHLLGMKGPEVSANLARLDYAGISILIYGTAMPAAYYGFACNEVTWLKNTFLNILGTASIACFVLTMLPSMGGYKIMRLRAIMFLTLGGSAALGPLLMKLYPESCVEFDFFLYTVGAVIYVTGAIVYIVRYPERAAPGHYDLCGASHQLFHVCVLFASLVHYQMNYTAYIDRQNMTCPIWVHE